MPPSFRRVADLPPGWIAGGVLFVIYALTAAPDITLWDAGELAAAARTFGIPHPPGTPMFVAAGRVATMLLPFGAPALATNLLSALCTAVAGGIAATLIARWLESRLAGVIAALVAGTMVTVWLNATETEVYAASLLLSMLALWAGDAAARGKSSASLAVAYCAGLAVPIHLSALVAIPAAALRASQRRSRFDWPRLWTLAAAFFAAAAIGVMSRPVAVVAAIVAAIGLAITYRRHEADERAASTLDGARLTRTAARVVAPLAAVMAGASGILILYFRARHDPLINQGNPSTLHALVDVVARRQYNVAPIWPRQAPLWLQVGNFFQWADWQTALGVAPSVLPSVPRMLATAGWFALAVAGAIAHRKRDPISFLAFATLVVSASLGVVVYLNLKAGPSFGYGIIPDDAPHEARERDYFFALAFWSMGLWAGVGIVDLATRAVDRAGRAGWAVLALAIVPLIANWRAANRRSWPASAIPRTVGVELLRSTPPNAVLVLTGDNDSFAVWYAQAALGLRPDVQPVTIPLLGAPWYRAELARRGGLIDTVRWKGTRYAVSEIARRAAQRGRPVAMAATVPDFERPALGAGETWRLSGLVWIATDSSTASDSARSWLTLSPTRESARRIGRVAHAPLSPAPDPTAAWMQEVLRCPSYATDSAASARLDSLLAGACNRR